MSQIVLYLTPEVRQALLRLLAASTRMADGARVVDHLPNDPWGDLDEFRRRVYEPLRLSVSSTPDDGSELLQVAVEDTPLLFAVVDGLAESFSGGVPWSGLTPDEHAAVTRCLNALGK